MARPRTFDESTVIAAARDRFWSTGYAGTSLDDLHAATGLGRSSLYGSFGDKHDLFLQALDRYCKDQFDQLEAALRDSGAGAFERLSRHIRATAELSAGNLRGCFLGNATAELGARDPMVAQRAQRAYGEWTDLLTACLEQAQEEGDVDRQLDPVAAASLVLGAMRGMVSLGQAGESPAVLKNLAEMTLVALRPR